jgi:hypothetical protein
MFGEILEDGVRWSDGTVLRADVILWCTGSRSSLDHLAPLGSGTRAELRVLLDGRLQEPSEGSP